MGAVDEIIERHGSDSIGAAKEIVRGLMRGNRGEKSLGYGPTPASALALRSLNVEADDPGRAQVVAHALGYHDALLRDGGGYKVDDEVGADYEEGHRLGASEDREMVYPDPRELQTAAE